MITGLSPGALSMLAQVPRPGPSWRPEWYCDDCEVYQSGRQCFDCGQQDTARRIPPLPLDSQLGSVVEVSGCPVAQPWTRPCS